MPNVPPDDPGRSPRLPLSPVPLPVTRGDRDLILNGPTQSLLRAKTLRDPTPTDWELIMLKLTQMDTLLDTQTHSHTPLHLDTPSE